MPIGQNMGVTPQAGSGSRPSGGAEKPSPAKPSIPNAFTPGPWHVEEIKDDECSPLIYGVCHPGTVCDATTICNVENEANARLISAAPDMFEALVELATTVNNPVCAYALSMFGQRSPEEMAALAHKVQSAVAKARGEQVSA